MPTFLSSHASNIPFKRLGTVDEVSSLITFLSSEASSYISGQNFTIDGGLEIHSNFLIYIINYIVTIIRDI